MAVTLRIQLAQVSQDRANNTSTVNAKVYVDNTQQSYNYMNPPGNLTLDGTTYYFNANLIPYATTLLYEVNKIVKHNDDGNKTVYASASYATDVSVGTLYANTNLPLTKINRQSKINAFPLNIDIEQSVTLSITKYMGDYTDSLNIYFGDNLIKTVGNIVDGIVINFTEEEINQIYSLTPDNKFFELNFVLSSYDEETFIGSSETQCICLINGGEPIFKNFEYEDINETTTSLTGDNQVIIQNYSNIEVIISEENKAIAQKEANMQNYLIDGINVPYQDEVSLVINNYSKETINITALDSRQKSSQVNKTVPLISYAPLIITDIPTIERKDAVGEETRISFRGEFWNNNFGEIDNELTVTYKYKVLGSSGDYEMGRSTIIPTIDGNEFNINALSILGDTNAGFNTEHSYEIIVSIEDKLSKQDITYSLIAGEPAIIIEGNKVLAVNNLFPIGFILMTVSSVNPSTYYGGTWEQIAKGRTLVGVDENDNDFNAPEKIGGEKTHLLTEPEMSGNVIVASDYADKTWCTGAWGNYSSQAYVHTSNYSRGNIVGNGSGKPHNIMQPFFTCYIWQRIE